MHRLQLVYSPPPLHHPALYRPSLTHLLPSPPSSLTLLAPLSDFDSDAHLPRLSALAAAAALGGHCAHHHPTPHPWWRTPAADQAPTDALLAAASRRLHPLPPQLPPPGPTHEAVQAILSSALEADTPALAAAWHTSLLGAWPDSPDSPAHRDVRRSVAHAVAGSCNALSSSSLRHLPDLLLLLTATGAPPGLSAHAARLVRAHHLLSWLATTPVEPWTSDGCPSLLEAIAWRSALPPQLTHAVCADAAAVASATASVATAALQLTLNDVRLADATEPAATAHHTLSTVLAAAGLWRPLAAYLRLLRSQSPLHAHLLAHTHLHAGRYDRAAADFHLAVQRAVTSSTFSLADLNTAARVPALPREEPLQVR